MQIIEQYTELKIFIINRKRRNYLFLTIKKKTIPQFLVTMDIIYMIWFVPLFLFLFALFYFVVMRKNDFEKRLAIFYPYRQLSQKREAYMQKVSKYSYIIFALFLLPFFFLVYVLFKENYQEISEANTLFSDENLMLMLAIFLPLSCAIISFFYMQQRSKKSQTHAFRTNE